MAITAGFNSTQLGDYVEEVRDGDNRALVVQPVAAENAIVTRNRGGGQLDITVQFNVSVATSALGLAYRGTLRAALGNDKNDLMIDGATFASDMLCQSVNVVDRWGSYVRLEAKFVGSQF